jgi:hypothetical protein
LLKKRLGKIKVNEIKIPSLKGSLIAFDKVAFFPANTSKIILLF